LRFKRGRFLEGYNMADVDEFLHRAHHALESRDGSITSEDVHNIRFKPTRLKEGYHMLEVDEELDRVAAAIQRLEQRAAD
jgi:DivIVA domain-containing protein